MTSVQSHHLVSHSGANLDNNLDALLDDLQSGVGPRGEIVTHHSSLVNGGSINLPPGATGYRETTTTVTRERNGVPMTSRDYQIEYLNPANSVTVVSERSSSPNPEVLLREGPQSSSFKKASYEYKYSSSASDNKGHMQPVDNYAVSKSEVIRDGNRNLEGSYNQSMDSSNLNRNLNELDSLLYELNTAQRTPNPPRRAEHASRSIETRVQRDYQQSSTPRSASLTRDVQRDFQHYNDAPGTPRAPQRGNNVAREVTTIEQRSHTSRRDSPGPGSRDRSLELSPTLRRRTPSPSGEFRPVNFSSYPHSPHETRSRSQTRWEESSSSHTSQNVSESKYRTNYTTHASPVRSDDPQPYRSPSPVSFPQRRSPSPVRRAVSRSDSGRTLTYQVSPNQPLQPLQPLSDPSSPTVITYKYSSHSSQHNRYPGDSYSGSPGGGSGPRPFPTAAPIPDPGEQNPPKKLDDLMASFHDGQRSYTTTEQYYREEESRRRNAELQRSPSFERNIRPSSVKATQVYQTPQERVPAQAPVNEMVPPPSPAPQSKQQQLTKSVAGPPVYYPPGVELFAKKEEALMEQESAGGKGKMKGKAKMKYKYEASEKSKEKKSSGVAAVPICLPLCCAMPCSIM